MGKWSLCQYSTGKNSRKDAEQVTLDGRRLEKWGQQAWEGGAGEGAHSIMETVSCGTGGTTSLSMCCYKILHS